VTAGELRRGERALTAPADLAAICDRAAVCHVGFVDRGEPYVLPLNFGWEPGPGGGPARFWFHSAPVGRKIGLLAARPRVCLQLECDLDLVTHPDRACAWTQAYRSLVAWGRARTASDPAAQRRGLDAIMERHAGRGGWDYPDAMLARTLVWCVEVEQVTGKVHVVEGPVASADPARVDSSPAPDPQEPLA